MNYEPIDRPSLIAKQEAYDQAIAQAELQMSDDFIAACKANDVSAPCIWAPLRMARDGVGKYTVSTLQTLDDVMEGSLNYGKGPSTSDVMALLLSVAYGDGDQKQRAQALIARMAATYARFNVDES